MKRLTHIATAALLVSLSAAACNDDPLLDLGDRLPPTMSISSPDNNGTYTEGAAIAFDGSGVDQDGNLLAGAQLVWTSSLDGQIGTGATFTRNDLSVGAHEITLTGTDGAGETNSISIDITVEEAAANTPPVATITAPANDSEFDEGADVTFEGTGQDDEDGALTGASLVWNSNVDGDLGTGTTLTVNTLSAGPHTISLTATDSQGETGVALLSITINALPPSFAADVQPYFVDSGCTGCHGAANQFGGIRLDSYTEITTGGNANGDLIVAGDATQGILIPKLEADHQNGADDQAFVDNVLAPWINDGAQDN